MMRPGSWLLGAIASGAARAAPLAASAPPVNAALRRKKSLRSFFAIRVLLLGGEPVCAARFGIGKAGHRAFPAETLCAALRWPREGLHRVRQPRSRGPAGRGGEARQ